MHVWEVICLYFLEVPKFSFILVMNGGVNYFQIIAKANIMFAGP